MADFLVVAHGSLASSLVDTAWHIIGKTDNLTAFDVPWHADVVEVSGQLGQILENSLDHQTANGSRGVLILTDLFGGTPYSVALPFCRTGSIDLITGVNLPMIIKAMTLPPNTTADVAAATLRQQGTASIYIASEWS